MTIAIAGASCTGKTAVANALAAQVGVPVRHCGELLKATAARLACGISGVPDEEHARLDEETRTFANHSRTAVVEGRFLNYVLRGVSECVLVQLTCSDGIRNGRYSQRKKGPLSQRDREDQALALRLYNQEPLPPAVTIDTSSRTAEETATEILKWLARVQQLR